jgi:CIC family chloride channel protein
LGGLLLGLLLLQWPQVFGVGYGTINLALQNQLTPIVFLTLIFVKTLATSLSLGSGKSGGVFAPSLFLGAMTGGFLGWIFHGILPFATAGPGAYALVAMGALVACTTHAPITAIIIIFELTGTYEVILPLMITCIISTLITSTIKKDSIYTMKLSRRGVIIPKGWEQRILHTIKVREVMSGSFVRVTEDTGLADVVSLLKKEDVSCVFVTKDNEELTGIISFRDIRPFLLGELLLRQRKAGQVASREIVGISPSGTVHEALHLMGHKNVSQLPVLAEDGTGKVIGIITEKDAVAAYDQRVSLMESERF